MDDLKTVTMGMMLAAVATELGKGRGDLQPDEVTRIKKLVRDWVKVRASSELRSREVVFEGQATSGDDGNSHYLKMRLQSGNHQFTFEVGDAAVVLWDPANPATPDQTQQHHSGEQDDDLPCDTCGTRQCDENTGDFLFCDGRCKKGWHLSCIDPPMTSVPEEDKWYCQGCLDDESFTLPMEDDDEVGLETAVILITDMWETCNKEQKIKYIFFHSLQDMQRIDPMFKAPRSYSGGIELFLVKQKEDVDDASVMCGKCTIVRNKREYNEAIKQRINQRFTQAITKQSPHNYPTNQPHS